MITYAQFKMMRQIIAGSGKVSARWINTSRYHRSAKVLLRRDLISLAGGSLDPVYVLTSSGIESYALYLKAHGADLTHSPVTTTPTTTTSSAKMKGTTSNV